jgi:hypothetical protein
MAFFAVVAPLAFLLFARWGPTGVAAVWLCVIPALSLPLYAHYVWRRIGVTWGDWLRAIWPAMSSSAAMAVVVQAIAMSHAIQPPLAQMAVQIAAGGSVYAGMLWIAHRRAADALLRLARRNHSSRVPAPATLSPGSA